jgi:TonB family protein
MAQKINTKSNSASATTSGRPIMGITLIISLLLHVCILLGIQKAFPINWTPKPLRTYHVELLPPAADLSNNKKTPKTEPASTRPQKKAPPEKTEDTISLDTKDKRYISYAKAIKRKLMQHWKYPREAKENLIEGKVLALFVLNRQGLLKDIRILQPSSHDILDGETVRAIRAAAPFPPFPGSVTVTRLNIKANFAYRLTAPR